MSNANKNLFSPHLQSGYLLEKGMGDVMIALLPVTLTSIYFYGTRAIFMIIISIVSAVVTEVVVKKIGVVPPLFSCLCEL